MSEFKLEFDSGLNSPNSSISLKGWLPFREILILGPALMFANVYRYYCDINKYNDKLKLCCVRVRVRTAG